jgi:hypothetical protein
MSKRLKRRERERMESIKVSLRKSETKVFNGQNSDEKRRQAKVTGFEAKEERQTATCARESAQRSEQRTPRLVITF